MKPHQAISAMRLRADNLAIQRARLSGVLRSIFDIGGIAAVRAMTAAEIERLPRANNDNGDWIG